MFSRRRVFNVMSSGVFYHRCDAGRRCNVSNGILGLSWDFFGFRSDCHDVGRRFAIVVYPISDA
jgi:hypothetical protein